MFNFESLNQIQIEITNRCQAACPMCLRNVHSGIDNPLIKLSDWTIKQFQDTFNKNVLSQIKVVSFCGDFGDPILNNDLIEMCMYLKSNSTVTVHIHTNGSARNAAWWKSLADALPTSHRVEFAIDGLADTHKLYRIGTDYDQIIRNASAFIVAGGNAHWMMLKFKHNEHQIDIARKIATSLKFKSFSVKVSKRFGKPFPVLDRNGQVIHYIEQPTNSNVRPVEFVDLENYKEWKSKINCFTFDNKELYIDAHGHMLPCCIIASFLYANYDVALYTKHNLLNYTSILSVAKDIQNWTHNLIQEFGGLDMLDTKIQSIQYIMSTPIWQELIHSKWAENSAAPCAVLCGSNSPYISIDKQVNQKHLLKEVK